MYPSSYIVTFFATDFWNPEFTDPLRLAPPPSWHLLPFQPHYNLCGAKIRWNHCTPWAGQIWDTPLWSRHCENTTDAAGPSSCCRFPRWKICFLMAKVKTQLLIGYFWCRLIRFLTVIPGPKQQVGWGHVMRGTAPPTHSWQMGDISWLWVVVFEFSFSCNFH